MMLPPRSLLHHSSLQQSAENCFTHRLQFTIVRQGAAREYEESCLSTSAEA